MTIPLSQKRRCSPSLLRDLLGFLRDRFAVRDGLVVLALGVISTLSVALDAEALDVLYPRDSGTTQSLRAALGEVGRSLAVGEGGIILTSTNAVDWIEVFSAPGISFSSVARGPGGYVAVGRETETSGVIYASPDGLAWSRQQSVAAPLEGVSASGSRWVTVGGGGIILTSLDGKVWKQADSPTTLTLRAVAAGWDYSRPDFSDPYYFKALYYAVGDHGTVVQSLDGLIWTTVSSGVIKNLRAISALSPRRPDSVAFVAAGEGGLALLYTTEKGWTPGALPVDETIVTAVGAGAWGNFAFGQYCLATESGTVIALEPVGINDVPAWRIVQQGVCAPLQGLGLVNGGLMAVGKAGALWTELAWTHQKSGTDASLTSVAYGAGRIVAVGRDVGLTSTNGVDWTPTDGTSNSFWNGVAYGGGRFVAVGTPAEKHGGFRIGMSEDGIHWTVEDQPQTPGENAESYRLAAVTYGNGRFVAVGSYVLFVGGSGGIVTPRFYHSTDGVHWTLATTVPRGLPAWPNSVYYVGSRFLVPLNSAVLVSTDGSTWEGLDHPIDGLGGGFGKLGSQYLAVRGVRLIGESQTIWLSQDDGLSWHDAIVPIGLPSGSLTSTGARLFSFGASNGPGMVGSTSDGVTWWRGLIDLVPNAAVLAGKRIVLVGENGTILLSNPLDSMIPRLSIDDYASRILMTGFQEGRSVRLYTSSDLKDWVLWKTVDPVATGNTINTPRPGRDIQFFKAIQDPE